MSLEDIFAYALTGVGLFSLLILIFTDRWGHLIGTHNWRVSRRMDRRDRERRRRDSTAFNEERGQ